MVRRLARRVSRCRVDPLVPPTAPSRRRARLADLRDRRARGRRTTGPAGAAPSTAPGGHGTWRCPPGRRRRRPAAARRRRGPRRCRPRRRSAASGKAPRHSHTARTATGCTAPPDSPPPPAPRTGRPDSVSRARPSSVFTSVSPSAPPSTAPAAISTRSGTFGLSLAQRGSPHAVAARTSRRRIGRVGEHPRAVLHVGAAHVDLERDDAASPRPRKAATATSAAAAGVVRHASDPRCSRQPRAGSRAAPGDRGRPRPPAPGPADPTLLSMPAPTSCTRGAGLPGHGSTRERLDDDRAELRQVAVLGQLGAVARRPRRRHDRVGQIEAPDAGGERGRSACVA